MSPVPESERLLAENQRLRKAIHRMDWANIEELRKVGTWTGGVVESIRRLAGERDRLRADLARARGLAQSLAELPEAHRTEGVREIGRELVESLSEEKGR